MKSLFWLIQLSSVILTLNFNNCISQQIQWEKYISLDSVQNLYGIEIFKTSDNNLIIGTTSVGPEIGYTFPSIFKFDNSGNILWYNKNNKINSLYYQLVRENKSNDIEFIGSYSMTPPGMFDGPYFLYISRFEKQGKIIYDYFDTTNKNELSFDIGKIIFINDFYINVVSVGTQDSIKIVARYYNNTGIYLYKKFIVGFGNYEYDHITIKNISIINNKIIISGQLYYRTNHFDSYDYILIIDSNFVQFNFKEYNTEYPHSFKEILQNSDSTFLILGRYWEMSLDSSHFLWLTNSNFDIIKEIKFKGKDRNDAFVGIKKVSDGGYIIFGRKILLNKEALFITKLSKDLEIENDFIFKTDDSSKVLSDYVELKDKSLIFCGSYNYQLYLVKINDMISGFEDSHFNDFSISPNPAVDKITIIARNDISSYYSNYKIDIYNMMGEKVKHPTLTLPKGVGAMEVDVSSLPAGVYYISLKSGGQFVTKQFAVVR